MQQEFIKWLLNRQTNILLRKHINILRLLFYDDQVLIGLDGKLLKVITEQSTTIYSNQEIKRLLLEKDINTLISNFQNVEPYNLGILHVKTFLNLKSETDTKTKLLQEINKKLWIDHNDYYLNDLGDKQKYQFLELLQQLCDKHLNYLCSLEMVTAVPESLVGDVWQGHTKFSIRIVVDKGLMSFQNVILKIGKSDKTLLQRTIKTKRFTFISIYELRAFFIELAKELWQKNFYA